MSFQENLIKFRKEKSPSAKAFAQNAGISYTTYHNYEKGAWPSEENLIKIADALHVSTDELLGYSAPAEHLRLISIARACGLEVHEQKDNQLYISISKEAKANLSEAELKQTSKLSPISLPQDLFDSAMNSTEKAILQRNKQQVLFTALYELNEMLFLT